MKTQFINLNTEELAILTSMFVKNEQITVNRSFLQVRERLEELYPDAGDKLTEAARALSEMPVPLLKEVNGDYVITAAGKSRVMGAQTLSLPRLAKAMPNTGLALKTIDLVMQEIIGPEQTQKIMNLVNQARFNANNGLEKETGRNVAADFQ